MWRSIWASHSRLLQLTAASWWLALALALPYPSGAADETLDDLLFLAVNINGVDQAEVATVLRLADGGLAVAEGDLRSWRLKPPAAAPLPANGRSYVRLADLTGIEYRLDSGRQALLLRAPASAFAANALAHDDGHGRGLTPSRPGGFVNYDLNWQRDGDRTSHGGLFELGAFNAWGSGTTSGLWRNGGPGPRWLRLDTTWNLDMPERMQSLRLGDAIGRAGSWGRSVRFGGLQWSTNFATQPGFLTFPLPTLRGEAALPSTLDLYLDNARLLHDEVPPGPFDLSNVPVLTGQGELQLVVRDLLGRQQVIRQPYYASQQLLRPGLRDFTREIGLVREDYGSASAHYGRFMLATTERLGLRPDFTGELRAELLADQQTIGASGVWLPPRLGSTYLGTVSFGAAISHGPDGTGRLFALGGERRGQETSFNLQAQYAERGFVQLGRLPGTTPRHTVSASLGLPLGGNSLGLGYAHQSTWEGDNQRLLSASYSQRLGATGQIGLYALRNLSGEPEFNLGVILTLVLDDRTSLNADLNRQNGRTGRSLQVQRSLPAGNGFGYRLRADDDEHYQAGATWQGDHAVLTAEAARSGDQDGYRAGLSGGIAVAGGGAFLSRRLDDSFAVVKVADYAGVRIYRDHQEVTRTDGRGLALVTRLRAYQDNPVGIEQADLPIDAEVATLQLKLTPALRSGVVVDFPVRRSRGATFRLVDDAGLALPPGALVRIEGDAQAYPVGYDGRAFASGLGQRHRLEAEWAGRRCRAELILDAGAEPLPDLGTLTCKGTPP